MCSHPESERAEASFARAEMLVDQLIARARKLSLDLRPGMLDDLGLLPALLWYIEQYTAQTNVKVAFKSSGLDDRRLAPEVETAAYRIVQEALTNIARHSGVTQASVRAWTDGCVLTLEVEDGGCGFDPELVLAARESSGLAGMRERATILGGRLAVESQAGTGTRLTAELLIGDE
jgi:signal transduction histidine kinase